MKRFVALILCFSLLCVGCAKVGEKRKNISVEQTTVPSVEFRDISNPNIMAQLSRQKFDVFIMN